MTGKKWMFAAAFALGIGTAHAQTEKSADEGTYAYSLTQCIDYALKNRAAVKNADLDVEKAHSKVNELIGAGLPQLNASLQYNRFLAIPTQLLPGEFFGAPAGTYIPVKFGVNHNATASLSASQLIFSGAYFVGLQASKTYVELAEKVTDTARIAVGQAVAKAYYGVIINEKQRDLLEANVERLEKTYAEIKALNAEGFVEKLDVDRMTVSLNNLKVQLNNVNQFIGLNYYLLKFQMGMPYEQKLVLTDTIAAPTRKTPIAPGAANYNNRPEWALIQKQHELLALDVKRNKFEALPTLAAFGSLGTNAQRAEFTFFDTKQPWFATSVVGLNFNVPIFDGFQRHQRTVQAQITLQQVDNTTKEIANALDLQINSARISFNAALESERTSKESLTLAEEIVRTAQIKYDEGVGSNLEVTTAETELKTAQTNYYQSLYNLLISDIDYQRASGELKY